MKNPENAELNTFVARLLEEKGLTGLDDEVREQMQKDLLDRVEDRINAAILANLPEDKLGEFNALLDQDDDAKTQAFCEANIADLPGLVAGELMRFRDVYVGG